MKIGLFGRGRLGAAIAQEAGDRVVWMIGRESPPAEAVDVVIDASHANAVVSHVDWALASGTPLVIGVTGFAMPQLAEHVGQRIGVLVAPNFSLTVALLVRMTRVLGRFCAQDSGRDPFIVEHHHRMKLDAPSGTAQNLAKVLTAECPRKTEWTLGSAAEHQLSVGVVRAGAEFGTHTVGVDARAELLTITHTARSRAAFAQGALLAADWLLRRKGLYSMDDLAAELLDPLFEVERRS
jgi:4-hydroxy-tetrahydrodipicolinate reductase